MDHDVKVTLLNEAHDTRLIVRAVRSGWFPEGVWIATASLRRHMAHLCKVEGCRCMKVSGVTDEHGERMPNFEVDMAQRGAYLGPWLEDPRTAERRDLYVHPTRFG